MREGGGWGGIPVCSSYTQPIIRGLFAISTIHQSFFMKGKFDASPLEPPALSLVWTSSRLNAPPMIGEDPFCKGRVGCEYELGPNCTAHGVCQQERVSDLRCLEYFSCDVDYGGEDGHPIGMMRCWVANICPRVPSHCCRVDQTRQDGVGGESDRAPHENGTGFRCSLLGACGEYMRPDQGSTRTLTSNTLRTPFQTRTIPRKPSGHKLRLKGAGQSLYRDGRRALVTSPKHSRGPIYRAGANSPVYPGHTLDIFPRHRSERTPE